MAIVIVHSNSDATTIVENGIKPIFSNTSYGYLTFLNQAQKTDELLLKASYLLEERFPRIKRLVRMRDMISLWSEIRLKKSKMIKKHKKFQTR